MRHPETMIAREDLCERVWPGLKVSTSTVNSHVSRLRQRLRPTSVEIEPVYGGGYILR